MFKVKALYKVILAISFLAASTALKADDSWRNAFYEKVKKGERPEWMLKQIEKDLAPFAKKGVTKNEIDQVERQSLVLKRYRLIKGKAYVNGVPAKNALGKHLEQIANLVKMPDLDFILSEHDSFHHDPYIKKPIGPLFSFAKREGDSGIILIPDMLAIEGSIATLTEVAKGNAKYPWEQKVAKAFWRGRSSGFLPGSTALMNPNIYMLYPRCQLVQASLDHPKLLDAKFNATHADPYLKKLFREKKFIGSTLAVSEHMRYKYQILVDSYSCAFERARWQLFANSLIFKQDSPDYQWYSAELKANQHYVSVANNFSDLIEKIEWAKDHDEECAKMVREANKFAETHLTDVDISLYLYLLFTEYAKVYRS